MWASYLTKDFQIFKNFRGHIYRGVGVCVNGDTPRGGGYMFLAFLQCHPASCHSPTPPYATAAGCIALRRG